MDIRLGQPDNPVNMSDTCVLERTQADPASTIRACLCNKNFCNDVGPQEKPRRNDGKLLQSGLMRNATMT